MGYLTEVNILVTGSNGQLGTCIKDEVDNGNSKNIWHFADRSIVDITDIESIRKFVIDNLSKTGGHVASNLGIVELTVGLHYVFNSPVEKRSKPSIAILPSSS